jgi:hypothetical protein
MDQTADNRSRFRMRFAHLADGLVIAAVVLLPWSISLSLIMVVLWLIAILVALPLAQIGREIATPAGGLPVALIALALGGMFWSDVDWAERVGGATPYFRLLAIPLLLAQFRRSERGRWVLTGYVASCTVLLALAWTFVIWPQTTFLSTLDAGVPIKGAAAQSGEFTICLLALSYLAIDQWRRGSRRNAAGALALALMFLANILYVSISLHTYFIVSLVSLFVIPLLLVLLLQKSFGIRTAAVAVAAVALFGAAAWASSPSLRAHATTAWHDVRVDPEIWLGRDRPILWGMARDLIREAPVLGHGTGSIRDRLSRAAAGRSGAAEGLSANPHQQTLEIAIQFGIVGVVTLWAMWLSHLLLFRGCGLPSWVGLVVVAQNIIGSMFSSHLAEFTQAWIYALIVGTAGGMVLRSKAKGEPGGRFPPEAGG